jgi:hypothetical protein
MRQAEVAGNFHRRNECWRQGLEILFDPCKI